MELQKNHNTRARVGDRFESFVSKHAIWQNPLLKACERNELTLADYGYIISQHFYYSKGFTRLISALMVNCDDDKYRAELSHNLWEEAGEENSEERHSNLLRKMLNNVFGINDPDQTEFKDYTVSYFDDCLRFLKNSNCIGCAAFLGWGTEGVVANIYNYLFTGLTRLGVAEEELLYLSLHMECDDEHAEVIEDIALSQCSQCHGDNNREIEAAIDMALTLRDKYFTALYRDITSAKLNPLLDNIVKKEAYRDADEVHTYISTLKPADGVNLYSNKDKDSNIDFNVSRFNIGCEVMDPRLLEIPQGCQNECHKHAHESMFFVLSGTGRVHQGDKSIEVKAGDLVYVPRWVEHYSKNTGGETLSILAVTDFGLTKHFPQNTDYSYRKKVSSIA
ncbi:iron-containing redox enzyme family protein [Thalassomonas viridans]|uniref:Iron-containing redox enzyme family protein n=1 Tax=Thalassomonas viridans TaxID=137584 RepID=A0AAE9Z524_9GAMM|nr:iron-containing redox enzyme family protein [Thalassomonas viridans]WDE05393.1 iron-containing redox enzyme family protein [Thalassomonas viridans]